jgi:copper homeostasis protein (lipoprotein)
MQNNDIGETKKCCGRKRRQLCKVFIFMYFQERIQRGFVLVIYDLIEEIMKTSHFFPLALLISIISCEPPKQTTQEKISIPDPAHNSQNSLDWEGVYTGIVPCADCEGIQTTLILSEGLNYILETTYLGKTGETQMRTGTFGWNVSGQIVTLENVDEFSIPAYYGVGENHITQLDLKGNRIEGALANNYRLMKDQSGITEKYWKLIELNGRKITSPSSADREAFMLLKAATMMVTGNGGCNAFSGRYEISTGNRIRFSPIGATKMTCIGVDTEGQLFAAFEMTDIFIVENDTLSLINSKMAPLARFVLVLKP